MEAPRARWTRRALPAYAYRPGRNPHPRRHPGGHSYGHPEPPARRFDPDAWQRDEDYLYGIDLFHAGFWWEAHEVFEALWNGFGRRSDEARVLRALVLAAGAELKRALGQPSGAARLAARARAGLAELSGSPLGVDVRRLEQALRREAGPLRVPTVASPQG